MPAAHLPAVAPPLMLAHHDALMLLQVGGATGVSGFAAVVTARWYALVRTTRRRRSGRAGTAGPP